MGFFFELNGKFGSGVKCWLVHGQKMLQLFKNNGSGLFAGVFKPPSLSWFFLADPLPPARFEISKEKTTSTNLHIGWTPSPGRVTSYEVQLFDGHQKVQEAQIQESTSMNEYAFSNLTAGSKYNIAITAVSGNKRSSTIHINGSTGKITGSWVFNSLYSFDIILSSRNRSKNAPKICTQYIHTYNIHQCCVKSGKIRPKI